MAGVLPPPPPSPPASPSSSSPPSPSPSTVSFVFVFALVFDFAFRFLWNEASLVVLHKSNIVAVGQGVSNGVLFARRDVVSEPAVSDRLVRLALALESPIF